MEREEKNIVWLTTSCNNRIPPSVESLVVFSYSTFNQVRTFLNMRSFNISIQLGFLLDEYQNITRKNMEATEKFSHIKWMHSSALKIWLIYYILWKLREDVLIIIKVDTFVQYIHILLHLVQNDPAHSWVFRELHPYQKSYSKSLFKVIPKSFSLTNLF